LAFPPENRCMRPSTSPQDKNNSSKSRNCSFLFQKFIYLPQKRPAAWVRRSTNGYISRHEPIWRLPNNHLPGNTIIVFSGGPKGSTGMITAPGFADLINSLWITSFSVDEVDQLARRILTRTSHFYFRLGWTFF
jgi:hypothetical protein